jgi:hypothetical protein
MTRPVPPPHGAPAANMANAVRRIDPGGNDCARMPIWNVERENVS